MADASAGEPSGRPRGEGGERLVPADEVSKIVSDRVREVTERAAAREAELQAQLAAAKSAPAPVPAKTYTKEQLESAISDGKLTQAQANAIWERQNREQTIEAAKTAAIEAVRQESSVKTLDEKIAKYHTKYPDLLVEGTAERGRIAKEVRFQIETMGLKGLAAEYAALRTIYGDESALVNTQERERPGHEDVLGGGKGGSDTRVPGAPKELSAREQAYYADQIAKGRYKDWDEVKAEMKFANDRTRKFGHARAQGKVA